MLRHLSLLLVAVVTVNAVGLSKHFLYFCFPRDPINFYDQSERKTNTSFLIVIIAVHSPPRIIKQPPTDEILFQVAQTGENDKPFVIECEAEGEPAPK